MRRAKQLWLLVLMGLWQPQLDLRKASERVHCLGGLGVWGLGFGVSGLAVRVWGLEFGVVGLWGSELGVRSIGVWGLPFTVFSVRRGV